METDGTFNAVEVSLRPVAGLTNNGAETRLRLSAAESVS
jgi:hypothetical protein